MKDINAVQDEIIGEFEILGDDKESTIYYIMELGDQLPDFPEIEKKEENIIKGCQSKVWLITSFQDGKIQISGRFSNTAITRDLISLLIRSSF